MSEQPNNLESQVSMAEQEAKILNLKDIKDLHLNDLKKDMVAALDKKAVDLKISRDSKPYKEAMKRIEENMKELESLYNFMETKLNVVKCLKEYEKGLVINSDVKYLEVSGNMQMMRAFRDAKQLPLLANIDRDLMKTEIDQTLEKLRPVIDQYFDQYLKTVGQDLIKKLDAGEKGNTAMVDYDDLDSLVSDINYFLISKFEEGSEAKKPAWEIAARTRLKEIKDCLARTKPKLAKDDLFAVDNYEAAMKTKPGKAYGKDLSRGDVEAWQAGAREKYVANVVKSQAEEAKKEAMAKGYLENDFKKAEDLFKQAAMMEKKSYNAAIKLYQDALRNYEKSNLSMDDSKKRPGIPPNEDIDDVLASRI